MSGGTGGSVGAAGGGGALGGAGTGGRAGTPGTEAGSGADEDAGVPDGEAGSGGAGEAGSGGAGEAGSGGAGEAGSGGAGEAGSGGAGEAGSGGAGEAGSGGAGEAGSMAEGRCGTRGGVMCGDDEFCSFPPDAECGATDRGGMCEDRPEFCTTIYAPVCGCDNRTYPNSCRANSEGVSVKRDGLCSPEECTEAGGRPVYSDGASIPECASGEDGWNISGGDEPVICCLGSAPTGETCGGADECDEGEFCNYEPEAGGQGCDGSVADAAGVCQMQPMGCTEEYRPVCGCDRKTYGNACAAHAAGTSVLHEGECNADDCEAVGGRVEFGIGPAPMCEPGEVEHTFIVPTIGALPIEGAICCVEAEE